MDRGCCADAHCILAAPRQSALQKHLVEVAWSCSLCALTCAAAKMLFFPSLPFYEVTDRWYVMGQMDADHFAKLPGHSGGSYVW